MDMDKNSFISFAPLLTGNKDLYESFVEAKAFAEGRYSQTRVFPTKENMLKAFEFCEYKRLKVVIVGKTPFENHHANGLCYATNEEYGWPAVTENIARAITWAEHKGDFSPDLLEMNPNNLWGKRQATQGVLMLNVSLTTEPNYSTLHLNNWHPFISNFFDTLSKEKKLVWVFMGEHVHPYKNCLHEQDKQKVVLTTYPTSVGFKEQLFPAQVNQMLLELGEKPIVW